MDQVLDPTHHHDLPRLRGISQVAGVQKTLVVKDLHSGLDVVNVSREGARRLHHQLPADLGSSFLAAAIQGNHLRPDSWQCLADAFARCSLRGDVGNPTCFGEPVSLPHLRRRKNVTHGRRHLQWGSRAVEKHILDTSYWFPGGHDLLKLSRGHVHHRRIVLGNCLEELLGLADGGQQQLRSLSKSGSNDGGAAIHITER
mmetsp:Transcript_58455/g.128138  ORF Transcript_58455/g.128138 Transcript_58455/m.128138 type:complete len:200 (-) Transcript_58455:876-1475(-)